MCPSQALRAPSGFRHEQRVEPSSAYRCGGSSGWAVRREARAVLIPVELRWPRAAGASTNGGHHTVGNGLAWVVVPRRYASHQGLTAQTPHRGVRATQT
jgi:hypothetical protein